MSYPVKTEFFHTADSDPLIIYNPAKCALKANDFPSLILYALITRGLLECMILEIRELCLKEGPIYRI
jgi:hypothetical protein